MKRDDGEILVIGYGNPGRLDDGLGPALAERLQAAGVPGVTVDADYQLTVEDAAAAAGCEAVIFADAAVAGPEPFYFRRIGPGVEAATFSTHSITPQVVLQLARQCFQAEPAGYVLGIRGYEFDEFGERLSDRAAANLEAAFAFLCEALRAGDLEARITDTEPEETGGESPAAPE